MTTAFDYVWSKAGLVSDTSYPYNATYQKCPRKINGSRSGNLQGYTWIANDLTSYKNALATSQLSIALFVDSNWYSYKSGILQCQN